METKNFVLRTKHYIVNSKHIIYFSYLEVLCRRQIYDYKSSEKKTENKKSKKCLLITTDLFRRSCRIKYFSNEREKNMEFKRKILFDCATLGRMVYVVYISTSKIHMMISFVNGNNIHFSGNANVDINSCFFSRSFHSSSRFRFGWIFCYQIQKNV